MKKTKQIKRFQECNKLVQLWRRRWQIVYFFKAIYFIIVSLIAKIDYYETLFAAMNFIYLEWEMKANWYYTTEEVYAEIFGKDRD